MRQIAGNPIMDRCLKSFDRCFDKGCDGLFVIQNQRRQIDGIDDVRRLIDAMRIQVRRIRLAPSECSKVVSFSALDLRRKCIEETNCEIGISADIQADLFRIVKPIQIAPYFATQDAGGTLRLRQ